MRWARKRIPWSAGFMRPGALQPPGTQAGGSGASLMLRCALVFQQKHPRGVLPQSHAPRKDPGGGAGWIIADTVWVRPDSAPPPHPETEICILKPDVRFCLVFWIYLHGT